MKTLPLVTALCLSLVPLAQDDAQKELAKFDGTWQPIYIEFDGKEFKGDYSKDRLIVSGGAFKLTGPKVDQDGTLKIDGTKRPRTIDVEIREGSDKGTKTVGIYEIDAKRLMVCYVQSPGERPGDFTTKQNSGRALVIYQRAK